jgi:hypothetical protein
MQAPSAGRAKISAPTCYFSAVASVRRRVIDPGTVAVGALLRATGDALPCLPACLPARLAVA